MELAASEGLKHEQNFGRWDRMGIRYLGRLHARPYPRTWPLCASQAKEVLFNMLGSFFTS